MTISKKDCVIKAATTLFIERGFERTSMEEIAKSADVAKQTLYNCFSGKDDLFKKIIHLQTEEFFQDLPMDDDENVSIEQFLRLLGQRIRDAFLDKPTIELLRLVIAEARQFPELGTHYYDTCIAPALGKLENFLAGHGYTGNAAKAAAHFMDTLTGHMVWHALLDKNFILTEQMFNENVEYATSNFMRLLDDNHSIGENR